MHSSWTLPYHADDVDEAYKNTPAHVPDGSEPQSSVAAQDHKPAHQKRYACLPPKNGSTSFNSNPLSSPDLRIHQIRRPLPAQSTRNLLTRHHLHTPYTGP